MTSKPDVWTIRRQLERYPGLNRDGLPDEFVVNGVSEKQAQFIAKQLSYFYPGCEYSFYVVGSSDDE